MKIIVTGGSGFIGTNMVEHFLTAGYDVLNIDSVSPRNPAHRGCWRQVDLLDASELKTVAADFDPDQCLHLAAKTDLSGHTIEDYAANTTGLENLVSALLGCHRLTRVVFASTQLVCSGRPPVDEIDFHPINLYGESKVAGEKFLRSHPTFPFQWCIIRPTSLWGPWFGVPYRNFFEAIKSGLYMHIGKTQASQTYGYIGNSIRQIDALFKAPYEKIAGRVFYIGDAPPYVLSSWADEIATECGRKLHRLPMPIARAAGWGGDLLGLLGIGFPLTSFRIKNMTAQNTIDLSPIMQLVPNSEYSRLQAVRQTLNWLADNGKK